MTEELNTGRTALLRRTARSTRVRYAIMTAGLSSAGGFSISIALAHRSSTLEFGQFAVAMAVSTLAVGFAHAGVAEPLIGLPNYRDHLRSAGRRAALIGVAASACLMVAGLIVSSSWILWAGISSVGLVAYDYIKTVSVAVGRPSLAMRMEVANFTMAVFLAVLMLAHWCPPLVGFAIWVIVTGLIGIGAACRCGVMLVPGWSMTSVGTGTALTFGADYLIGSGSAQLITTFLGATGRLQLVGALRAGGTLMGPVTMAIGVSRTLLIPWLGKRHVTDGDGATARDGIAKARSATVMMAALAVLPLAFIAFLPTPLGTLILGQNWSAAQPLLPFLALEALLNIIGATPFAGHRTHLAGRRSLIVRLTVCTVRCTSVIGAGLVYGATGAAMAMAATALLGSVMWWASYSALTRRSVQ